MFGNAYHLFMVEMKGTISLRFILLGGLKN